MRNYSNTYFNQFNLLMDMYDEQKNLLSQRMQEKKL